MRTHFADWLDRPVADLGGQGFRAHCQGFAQARGNALVEVGRGIVTSLIRYLNAVHGLTIESPFTRLAAAGLMPERSQPRARLVREILERRCVGLAAGDQLFAGVSAEHVHAMAMRPGAPRFMLHDLRKMLATVGEKLGVGDAVLRRILNHTAGKDDVLHRHYGGWGWVMWLKDWRGFRAHC